MEDVDRIDVADDSIQSVATKGDVAFEHRQVSIEVVLRKCFILGGSLVHCGCVIESFSGPALDITVNDILRVNLLLVFSHEGVDGRILELSEIII